jgi:hypothetical protein
MGRKKKNEKKKADLEGLETKKKVAGHRDFKAIAVATDIRPGASPCGMCRQL